MILKEAWLWLWFLIFMALYWLKRAYYGILPPNPVAHTVGHYIQRSWAPLLVRMGIDSLAFWLLFTPGAADKGLQFLGWTNWAWAVSMITQFAAFAAMFGFFVDSVVDIFVSKIPIVRDILPQMPGPLPQEAVVEAQIVEQTTKVSQLQTTTTVIPEAKP